MELDIDLPNYLYNKPDGYYAEDIIKNRDETIESLKKDSIILKDRLPLLSTFRPLDTEIVLYSDPTTLKCEIKFIPKKFSVMNSMGRIYKALTCDVVLKNVTLGEGGSEFSKLFKDPQYEGFAKIFKQKFKSSRGKWDREFEKIAKLIGMEDYDLKIDDIIFEFDE
jgi:hypothetical protein